MAQGMERANILPEPAAEQVVTVEGEFLDAEDGVVPCVVVRMPWWRAQSLGVVLDRWTRVAEIVDESDGSEEGLLAASLQEAAQAAKSLRAAWPARAAFSRSEKVGQPDAEGRGEAAEAIE
jgi:hypothetical protein